MPTRGYIVVASRKKFFYDSAINLIDSLRDFDPNAKICLATEERFLDGAEHLADDIIFCGEHARSKIDGMANSPYDHTFYIDADCEVIDKDISTVFDKFDGNDVLFTYLAPERSYCYVEVKFPAGKFEWCGAVCLYDMTKPIVREFMRDWYELTVKQYSNQWWPTIEGTNEWDTVNYPRSLARWDQFSLWWLVNKDPKYCGGKLKVGRLDGEEDARWNHYSLYRENHSKGEPIIWHFSSAKAKLDRL